MTENDITSAARLIDRALDADSAARGLRDSDRIDATLGRRGYSSLPPPKVSLPLDPADAETLAVAFETIAKRLRGGAAALLVGPVEVGQ